MRISASPETHVVSVAFYMRPSASGATGSTVGQQEHRWCGTVSVICCGDPDRPQRLPERSKAVVRRAGCGKPARPDLWEPWADNCPGPPDRDGRHFGAGAGQPSRPLDELVQLSGGDAAVVRVHPGRDGR